MIFHNNDINSEITVKKVEADSDIAIELLHFVENCSWEEVRDHIADLIRSWDFSENEAVFAAFANKKIIGITTLMNTDYYPLPDIFPWISCIFVSEEYRGRRISEKLISHVNTYAKSLGYKKTYIPSSFFGLYEKYGYIYVKDIVNYGDETDHLFVKDI